MPIALIHIVFGASSIGMLDQAPRVSFAQTDRMIGSCRTNEITSYPPVHRWQLVYVDID